MAGWSTCWVERYGSLAISFHNFQLVENVAFGSHHQQGGNVPEVCTDTYIHFQSSYEDIISVDGEVLELVEHITRLVKENAEESKVSV